MGRFDDLNKIFEVADNSLDTLVIKVKKLSPLEVALHPFVSANMQYITVSKGRNHTLTVIYENGHHGDRFNWGDSGYTLISDGLEDLKKAVIKFAEDENRILLDADFTKITEAYICYNNNFHAFQLFVGGEGRNYACYRNYNIRSIDEMRKCAEEFIKVDGWTSRHYAINPQFIERRTK